MSFAKKNVLLCSFFALAPVNVKAVELIRLEKPPVAASPVVIASRSAVHTLSTGARRWWLQKSTAHIVYSTDPKNNKVMKKLLSPKERVYIKKR